MRGLIIASSIYLAAMASTVTANPVEPSSSPNCNASVESQLTGKIGEEAAAAIVLKQINECGSSAADVVATALQARPDLVIAIVKAAAKAAPDQVDAIVEAAIAVRPELAETIVAAVTDALPSSTGGVPKPSLTPSTPDRFPSGGSGGGSGGGITASSS